MKMHFFRFDRINSIFFFFVTVAAIFFFFSISSPETSLGNDVTSSCSTAALVSHKFVALGGKTQVQLLSEKAGWATSRRELSEYVKSVGTCFFGSFEAGIEGEQIWKVWRLRPSKCGHHLSLPPLTASWCVLVNTFLQINVEATSRRPKLKDEGVGGEEEKEGEKPDLQHFSLLFHFLTANQ